jgi:hypothetical protein
LTEKQTRTPLKYIYNTFIIILFTCSIAIAQANPEVIFTQEVATIDKDGNLNSGVSIEPSKMHGVKDYDFELGDQRLLRVTTNIKSPEERGIRPISDTIRRSYEFIEGATGQKLAQGVLLYIIELEEVPSSYSFKAAYESASDWGEVRLVLIGNNATLSGPEAPGTLNSLLYDTLPHELTHAALRSIPQLAHDISGKKSYFTRWFIEGVCETLAKEFARAESPAAYEKLLRLRKPDKVLAEPEMFSALISWQQENDNSFRLESDLYGAAMLTMMTWTQYISIEKLLNRVQGSNRRLNGDDLISLLTETTGLSKIEIAQHAESYGKGLTQPERGQI